MFKKFTPDGIKHSNAKSSVIRAIRQRIVEQYPFLSEEEPSPIDVLLPKKAAIELAKVSAGGETNNVQMVVVDGTPVFYNFRDGPYYPTLRVLHLFPLMMPRLRVDRGAIRFVLAGANIMCPGLTSPGACIHDEVPIDTPVAIFAEGKETPLAVGITRLSTADIVSVNKGIGVDLITYLNDGLWKHPVIS
ncbi:hypothetical protein PPROV_000098700 [Pycnococcus provasolii]|uniref:PUA domain-containing protein n=1 Tax=Pycnococcus provasolii TaxID=41880 RepID=A0A830H895_9CHLO|nr:hypothetical protein PPROV_000098700 [Pycnococcus provasolii]|mmetsp:Transcript_4931/g.11001  ORF Transcript_4931/g.11001 Transcript_4931/m.11001 type:complete len:190 (-) Transcript_4931:59-628(-)